MVRAGGDSEVTLQIGQIAPDFEQDTTNGSIRFHEWIRGSWCLLFSCPAAQPAELNLHVLAGLAEAVLRGSQWAWRGVRLIGVAARSSDNQARWQDDVARMHGLVLNFPVIADGDRSVSRLYRIAGADADRPAANQKCHVFVIDPNRRIRLIEAYSAALGCDFAVLQETIAKLRKGDARAAQASVFPAGMVPSATVPG